MPRTLHAAAGAFVLATAALATTSPALADGVRDQQQWYLDSLKVPQAHAISTGTGVTVSVIDTGVSPHHDLKGNLLVGTNGATGKADGRSDTVGHGTQMAGLIAAHGSGSEGLLGIAPSAKVLPVKISNSATSVPPGLVAKGIEFSIAHKARVINISSGTEPSFALVKAIKDANTAGVVIVAATGNYGGLATAYPAAADGVLAVGSTGRSGKHSNFSTGGPQVQICAPGEKIETLSPGNKYVQATGTSGAAAIVSGAVALVRARFPQLSAAKVIHRITATADDIGPPGRDDECGFGELNIVKALTADVPPLGDSSASASPGASDTASAPTGNATTGDAAPQATGNKSSSGPLIVGVVVVVLLVGGLVGLVAVRRRRS
jgi:type VII secretion-associated serine protease mycosin